MKSFTKHALIAAALAVMPHKALAQANQNFGQTTVTKLIVNPPGTTPTGIEATYPNGFNYSPFVGGVYRFSTNNNNTLVSGVYGSRPPRTVSFDSGITAYGQLASGSTGNNVFAMFARADCYAIGVCTNEVNSFGFNGDAPITFPWDRSNATNDNVPVALTVAAGGTKTSAAGIEISKEGGTQPSTFNFGIVTRKDAINVTGIYMDADGNTNMKQNMILKNSGQNSNIFIDTQTVGQPVAGNYVLRHRDYQGNTTLALTQGGDYISYGGAMQQSISYTLATGSTQGSAAPLTAATTVVSGAGGVILRNKAGERQMVVNRGGSTIAVYPYAGAQIENIGANVGIPVANGGTAVFVCFDATQCWRVLNQ